MDITDLGFVLGNRQTNNDFEVGRVIKVNKESYIISNGKKEMFGKLTGNMIYGSSSAEDFPTVGDFVCYQNFSEENFCLIHEVISRRNVLKRKTPGKKIDYQLIAANVDYGIIIQAVDADFSLNRVERYLMMLNEFDIKPIILLSKIDLNDDAVNQKFYNKIKSRFNSYKVVAFSNYKKESLEMIKKLLLPKKTYCIIGSSGVGKTTLINNLIGEHIYSTNEIREKDGKGKHTTTSRVLIRLSNGSIIIDTPGMRELANIKAQKGIEETFDDIFKLSNKCKFNNCTHTTEKGCAIIFALENGDLDSDRYKNYLKLQAEIKYNEQSYFERRKNDKEFGKMIKSVLKNKPRKRY